MSRGVDGSSRRHTRLPRADLLTLAHPRIPHIRPFSHTKPRSARVSPHRSSLSKELAISHTPLFPKRRTLLLLDEPVEFALDTLEPTPLATGELLVETLADFLPLLTQVDPVVPDEVHFFFFVLGAWRSPPVAVVAGAGRDGVVPLAWVVRVW